MIEESKKISKGERTSGFFRPCCVLQAAFAHFCQKRILRSKDGRAAGSALAVGVAAADTSGRVVGCLAEVVVVDLLGAVPGAGLAGFVLIGVGGGGLELERSVAKVVPLGAP